MNLLALFVVLAVLRPSAGARVLMMPLDHHANANIFSVAARALIDAGHDVTSLVAARHASTMTKMGVPQILLHPPAENSLAGSMHSAQLRDEAIRSNSLLKVLTKDFVAFMTQQCERLMQNASLLSEIRALQFDLVVIDGYDLNRCFYVLPHWLAVPYVTLSARHDPWSAGVPVLPSGEGLSGMMSMYADSGFLQRVYSAALYVLSSNAHKLMGLTDDGLIAKYAPHRPRATYADLYSRSELWLVNGAPVSLDYPRLYAPHYHFIGGLSAVPGQPLTGVVREIVDSSSADHGIIVVSFGSMLTTLPVDIVAKIFAALRRFPQRVLMRYDGNMTLPVPPNVKLIRWLPQNDLLADPKTRLFITHAGTNGQLEALYHGVPMLSMPVFGDQSYNARRAQDRGFGITVEPYASTAEQLADAVRTMLTDDTYRTNVRRHSEIYRSFPSPRQTLTFWVEHALRFGGSHLKPAYLRMPLWKTFMLDVLTAAVAVVVAVTALCCFCCRRLRRRCASVTVKSKDD